MEASGGLNPASSQGYLEVSSVEAKALAKAKLIDTGSVWNKRQKTTLGPRNEARSMCFKVFKGHFWPRSPIKQVVQACISMV